jgi:hypothetical protein
LRDDHGKGRKLVLKATDALKRIEFGLAGSTH